MEAQIRKYQHIITQSDAVLHFLQNLDIEMIDAVLEPNRTYQNFQKHIFIQKLGHALDQFIQSGDTYLWRYSGLCDSKTCNYQCSGYTFIGNHSGNYFDLIIDIKKGVVQDMYECIHFKCSDENIVKNRCIEIDEMGEMDDDDLPF